MDLHHAPVQMEVLSRLSRGDRNLKQILRQRKQLLVRDRVIFA
jgi:hypothetical protein